MFDTNKNQLVFIGADHGGWEYKENFVSLLTSKGYQIKDYSSPSFDSEDDYPPIAFSVAEQVSQHEGAMGVLLCRSGSGMIMAANKVPGVRAAVAKTAEAAVHARTNNNANVLSISADWISAEEAERILLAFLKQDFSGEERHLRRIQQIQTYEKNGVTNAMRLKKIKKLESEL